MKLILAYISLQLLKCIAFTIKYSLFGDCHIPVQIFLVPNTDTRQLQTCDWLFGKHRQQKNNGGKICEGLIKLLGGIITTEQITNK